MNRRTFLKAVPALSVLAAAKSGLSQDSNSTTAAAKDVNSQADITGMEPVILPKPDKEGGKDILASMGERKTIRNISDKKLPPQILSNLMWAAFGVNRENGPSGRLGRTAASASNSQEIDIYVAMPEGTYLYDGPNHRLNPAAAKDLRSLAGGRRGSARAQAPVRLIYVVDIAKFSKAPFQEPGLKDTEIQKSYYFVDTGLIAQNVYLFAAAEGLAAWFHNCNKTAIAKELNLRNDQRVLFAQTVGYPAQT